jgi:secreted PhoX family phosphatase
MEIMPVGANGEVDHAATTARWRILLKGGDPAQRKSDTAYNTGITENGWLACPDNLAFDNDGRLWITTDGGNDFGIADGIWATDVDGPGRALTRHFFRCPDGGEVTGPAFTPDGTTLFCAVQHPGDIEDAHFSSEPKSWPDFKEGVPPRPSVVAIRRTDGKAIG